MTQSLSKPLGCLLGYGAELAPGQRQLSGYAASAVASRGRRFAEPDCPTRSPFQRDRDRILHATAFRRLTYKTQVFVFHEGDHFRTRLTHSLEVAQIARTVARQLMLDEDLAEALALAHDLGHSPFGHAGERALDEAMQPFGGFDHNAQSVRVVTALERKYLNFMGLNLTWEMLEGLVKHNGPISDPASPLVKVVASMADWSQLDLHRWASAEAQVASLADDIAYLSHDVDDGLRAGLLDVSGIGDMPLAGPFAKQVAALNVDHGDGRAFYEVTRRMITAMVNDLVCQSRVSLATLAPTSPDEIRGADGATIRFSEQMAADMAALKRQLFERVYHHPRVMRVMNNAETIVRDLFHVYADDPNGTALPDAWRKAMLGLPQRKRARMAADYLAGQTDRYAIAEHRRLFDATPELR